MRILLDESIPRRLGALLVGHEATTVPKSGWAGIKNGKLLALAATKFDVFLTADRNVEFQQNLSALPIAILIVMVKSNRMEDVKPLVPEILKELNHLPPKTLRKVGDAFPIGQADSQKAAPFVRPSPQTLASHEDTLVREHRAKRTALSTKGRARVAVRRWPGASKYSHQSQLRLAFATHRG